MTRSIKAKKREKKKRRRMPISGRSVFTIKRTIEKRSTKKK